MNAQGRRRWTASLLAFGALGAWPGTVGAEEGRLLPVEVGVGAIRTHTMGVTPIGDRGCPLNQVSNAANFFQLGQGNTVTLQLGLVEGEGFGIFIPVDASQYPIEVNTVEFLIGSIAAVPTVTGFTVMIFDGRPQEANGTDRAVGPADYDDSSITAGSEEGLWDPITVPAFATSCNPSGSTTTAQASFVRAQLGVSSEEFEDRWILNNTRGENGFTVVVRIDEANAPGSTCGPYNRCQNAFLATESLTGGALNFPANDYLLALNCLAPFCPGGYSSFEQLASLCRPTRDPLIGAAWTSLSCGSALAACCNDTCTLTTEADCTLSGGTWMAAQGACNTDTCPVPDGACCFGTNCSSDVTELNCEILGGVYLGNNSSCTTSGACPTGACCFANGTCSVVSGSDCAALGGTFRGTNVSCASANCPQPSGACCTTTGGCAVVQQSVCNNAGGAWQGPGSACTPISPCGTGACCNGTTCTIKSSADCGAGGGVFQGAAVPCGSSGNPVACCRANFDRVSGVAPADIFVFLDAWFSQIGQSGAGLSADFDRNQVVQPADIFVFLNAWFANCPG